MATTCFQVLRGVRGGWTHALVVAACALVGSASAGRADTVVAAQGAGGIKPSAFRCGGGHQFHATPHAHPTGAGPSEPPLESAPPLTYGCDDGTVIDIMIAYTAQARAAAGDTATMLAHINQAVAETNAAFTRSLINTSLRLVYTCEVNYTETGNYELDTARLIDPNDGFLDELPPLRDQYGADCLSVWFDSYNLYGYGYYPDGTLTGIGASGLTLMDWRGYQGLLLAHEVGHNLWCGHQWGQNPDDVPFADYARGYVEPGNAWMDIMASAPVPRIGYYANPDVNWPGPTPPNPGPTGVPVGQPNPSNVALAINQTRIYVANFRATAVSGLPPVLYVRASAPPGGDGLSWTTAYKDLQDALCRAAGSGGAVQQLWVAGGTYTPDRGSGERSASFYLQADLALYGGFAGNETLLEQRDWVANPTILSGDLGVSLDTADNSYHVVRGLGVSSTAVLDGFTITAGNADSPDYPNYAGGGMRLEAAAPTITNCAFSGNHADDVGGGIACTDTSTPTFTDCTISANSAGQGGGFHLQGGSAATLTGCTFTGNSADWGGGLLNSGCSVTLTDCMFNQNTSINGGGGAEHDFGVDVVVTGCQFDSNEADFGAGIYHYATDAVVADCTFTTNSAYLGAGVYNYTAAPVVTACTFAQNQAINGGAGAGVWNEAGSAATFDACTFNANSAEGGAGAMGSGDSLPVVRNCTFLANTAAWAGAVFNDRGADGIYANCRFLGNHADNGAGGAMLNANSGPTVVNCAFGGNRAAYDGGALANYQGSEYARFINCTFALNVAVANVGGAISMDSTDLTLINTIVWANTDVNGGAENSQLWRFSGTPTLSYCLVQGWTGALSGTANSSANPLLLDGDGADNLAGTLDDDLRLGASSPAINTGDTAALPSDLADLDADGDTAEPTPLDLDGHPRVLGLVVDRGAYELVPAIPGDFDHDGDVDLDDFAHLADCTTGSTIAQTDPACLNARLDGDTDVDQADFGVFQRCYSGPQQPAHADCAD